MKNRTRGILASESGVKAETIRYYEKIDLMPEPARTEGGHRLYEDVHLQRLRFIRRSRELGFKLDEVRELLSLVDGQQVSCEKVQHIAEMHIKDVRAKIVDLREIERTLRDISSQCTGKDIPDCPIIELLQSQ